MSSAVATYFDDMTEDSASDKNLVITFQNNYTDAAAYLYIVQVELI